MDGALLVAARLLLAGVFAVAGAAKLLDRAGTRRAVADFGVPARLAGPLSAALPVTELAIAAALLPLASARSAAVAALLLLLTFLAAILVNLAKGRKPDCRCFGQLRAAPIGASTVALNLALLAVAGSIVWSGHPGASAVAWIGDLTLFERAAVAGLAAALAGIAELALLQWRMLQQQRTILARLDQLENRLAGPQAAAPTASPRKDEGLPVGTKAPSFALEALGGGHRMLDDLLAAGKPVLLVFTDPDCQPCEAMLPDLARWQRDPGFTLAVVSAGTPAENRTIGSHELMHVLLQWKAEVADDYECDGTPGAVLIRPDGTIGSPVAGGKDAIARLVATISGAPTQTPRRGSLFVLRGKGA